MIMQWHTETAPINISSWPKCDSTLLTASVRNGSMSHVPPDLRAEAQIAWMKGSPIRWDKASVMVISVYSFPVSKVI